MWRYLAGAGAALLLVAAGMMLQATRVGKPPVLAAMPTAAAAPAAEGQDAPVVVPEATAATREQKRFNRYDKDRDGSITDQEFLLARHKAFAKLDTNGDGTLSFDEWAAKAKGKFAAADRDKSGALNTAEFATTAVKRKAPRKANCPPTAAAARTAPAADAGDDEG